MKASKKIKKIIAAVVAFALIIIIGFFANGLVGNPLSWFLARNAATKYVKLNYPDADSYVTSAEYDFKMGCYTVNVENAVDIDSNFPLYCGFFGNITYDGYEDYVTNGRNTYDRLNTQYKKLAENVFNCSRFNSYTLSEDSFMYAVLENHNDSVLLVRGKEYDINELGKEYGHLVVSIDYDSADKVESAEELLLEIKDLFDKAELPFNSIDLSLSYNNSFTVYVEDFLYSDIYNDGLKERIESRNTADEGDVIKQNEVSQYKSESLSQK